MPCSLVPVACSLLVLFSGCSWNQILEDNFNLSLKRTEAPTVTLPTVEVPIRMLYPNGTKTVEGAISYMLEPHSYRPAYRNSTGDTIAERTFINNFNNDPVPLYVAIERLMGQDGQIILDKNRKLYTFQTRKPNESSIAFADLTTDAATSTGAATYTASPQKQPGGLVHDLEKNPSPVNKIALKADDFPPGSLEGEEIPAETPKFCNSIQFRNQSMLSATVQEYFLSCGFDKVLWSLGEPGRYADYRLLQNINLPLPERHQDLIEFLHSHFGIKTLIHDNYQVEFYDENNSL